MSMLRWRILGTAVLLVMATAATAALGPELSAALGAKLPAFILVTLGVLLFAGAPAVPQTTRLPLSAHPATERGSFTDRLRALPHPSPSHPDPRG